MNYLCKSCGRKLKHHPILGTTDSDFEFLDCSVCINYILAIRKNPRPNVPTYYDFIIAGNFYGRFADQLNGNNTFVIFEGGFLDHDTKRIFDSDEVVNLNQHNFEKWFNKLNLMNVFK